MGNKGSSYAEIFGLRQDLPAAKRGVTKGAYVNYMQFPLSGIVGISSYGKNNISEL